MRDPYPRIASLRRRYGADMPLRERARFWTLIARAQIANARRFPDALQLTYEAFADDPATGTQQISRAWPELSDIDPHARLIIKDYAPAAWRNMNVDQASWLSAEDMNEINAVLGEHPDLLAAFSYSLR